MHFETISLWTGKMDLSNVNKSFEVACCLSKAVVAEDLMCCNKGETGLDAAD